MQVRLLGPVDVVVDGESRPVRGVRRGAVLAVLALNCGEVVSTGRLVDLVWREAAPPLTSPRVPVPAQLPSALSVFAGRGAELASLDAVLAAADEAGSG